MSILDELRIDIGDDTATTSGIPIPSSSPLLGDLRVDIGDDGGISSIISTAPGQVPGSSTDNAIVRWNGTDGDSIQNSLVIIDDSGDLSSPGGATLGGDLVLNSALYFNCREITSGNVVVNSSDIVIAVNKTIGSPTSVELPSTAADGRVVIVKDKKGDANTNNITVDVASGGLIDGLTAFLMSQNYQSITFLYCAGSWSIV